MRSIHRGSGIQRFLGVAVAAIALGVIAGTGLTPVQSVSAQAPGTVTVQKALVNPANAPVTGDLANYVFTLTPAAGGATIQLPNTGATGQTTVTVAPGNYVINEAVRTGSTLQSFTIGGANIGIPGSVAVTSGGTVTVTATNQVAGSAAINIVKTIIDANNAPVPGADASGFTFTVANATGFTQQVTTVAGGTASVANLAAGTYSVTEQPRAGFTFVASSVDGVGVANGQTFNVAVGQARAVAFANRVGTATGTVAITKQMVDASGNITTGTLSGFTFTVACAATATTAAFSMSGTTDASGAASIPNVPAGNCTLTETVPSGFTFVSATPTGSAAMTTNGGQFAIAAGQTLAIAVRNRAGGGTAATEPIALFQGCNNVALTWTAGTPVTTVAAAISPTGNLESIWRYDNVQGRFFGFSPNPNAPSDYTAVQVALEPVFICMRGPGTLNRPVI